MATSISEIPPEFLQLKAHTEFISWLASIPAPPRSKKRLLVAWAKQVNYKLLAVDYFTALRQPNPGLSDAKL